MRTSILILCILTWWATGAMAKEVNVIMKDDSMIKGELIGISNNVVYLKAAENKAQTLKLEDVSEIFDSATGKLIPTSAINEFQPENIPPAASTNTVPAVAEPKPSQTLFFIFGTLQSGLVTYLPCEPLEETYIPGAAYMLGPQPYDSAWGAGLGVEYKFTEFLAGCFEASMGRWNKLLAKENGYGVGAWVWEQSGYNDARIGPFPMDVTYYMDTTIMRLGVKYYPTEGSFCPWIGASLGIYAWQATIGNRGEEKKYSEISSDISISPSFQAGIDLVLGEVVLRIFGDFGTAAVNPKFEDLFQTGWTFENTGGEHAEGPYRFGLALGMAL